MSTIIIMLFAGVVSVITIIYTVGVIVDDIREKRQRELGYPEDEKEQ